MTTSFESEFQSSLEAFQQAKLLESAFQIHSLQHLDEIISS
jgi:hypothetical protein